MNNKKFFQLLWPLILEQFLVMSIGLTDTFMVSYIGEEAISGVSLVDSINVLILQIVAALATGGAVIISQYLGQKNNKAASRCSAQLYTVLLIGSLFLMSMVLFFHEPILKMVFGTIAPEVMTAAKIYFIISAVSYPFVGIYNAGAASCRALGDSKTAMLSSFVMNIVNIAGNALLIYVFRMGVLGAAVASLIGRAVSAVWIVCRQQREECQLRIHSKQSFYPVKNHIKSILMIGIPSGIENGMFQIGKLILSSLTSTLGTAAIAANAVAANATAMSNIPGNALGLAAIPLVGQSLGAGNREEAREYGNRIMKVAIIGLAITNFLVIVLAVPVSKIFNLSPEGAYMNTQIMRWFGVFAIPFWATSFTLPNILRSGGDTRFTMTVSIFSMWICRIILAYLFVLHMGLGLLGIWLAMFIDWVCRSILFVARYKTDKWMEHRVVKL